MDKTKAQNAIAALALKGEPFTFRQAFGAANEAVGFRREDQRSPCYRLADQYLQKRRKQGVFLCRREGRTWIWLLNPSSKNGIIPF